MLAANQGTSNILFMANNAAGPNEMIQALGRERVLLGFPGAGGTRIGYVIRYNIVSRLIQPTTLGELNGQATPRLRQIADAFKSAGFPVATSSNMDAWLKTHVALVSPIANAIYLADGNNYRLARTRDGVVLMVRAIGEGYQVLQALGIPITPPKLRIFEWIPEPLLVAVLRRALDTEWAQVTMAQHANAAREEMQQLADEFRALARSTAVPTPAIDWLYTYIDPKVLPVARGSVQIRMNWRGTRLLVAVLVGLSAGLAWWYIGRRQRILPWSPDQEKD